MTKATREAGPDAHRPGAIAVAWLVAVAAFFGACDRTAAADTGEEDAAAEVTEADGPPPHVEPTLAELRSAHTVTDEGEQCTTDVDCDSPLRCLEEVCHWPLAMTGDIDDATPMVIFVGERMEARYFLEVASESWELARGLMHRRTMVGDCGMLFVFDADSPRSFWMRNTYIPLDMVFVTDAGIVDSSVENAEPRTETRRLSDGPARFMPRGQ